MKFIKYHSINKFIDETFDLLKKNELQNNLIIGNAIKAVEQDIDISEYLLATIKDKDDKIQLICMQTPPYPLLIYEVDNKVNNAALQFLIRYLTNHNIPIPGIVTEKSLSNRFIEVYQKEKKIQIKTGLNMRIYRLDKVELCEERRGHLRLATMDDLYFLPYWEQAFASDCHLKITTDDFINRVERIKIKINNKQYYVYEDTHPVSIISAARKTLNGIILSSVYTPPHYRKKGYATAMVADLSQKLLADGYQFCGLFTDLANPTSNKIYQKVGFKPICDYDEVWFTE